MSDISQYKFDIKQVGQFHFDCDIETPEHLIFTNKGIQAHPAQINNELLFKHFLDKNTKNHWALNIEVVMEQEKPAEIVPMQEVKEIIEPTESKIEETVENKQIIELPAPETIKDNVVFES